MYIYISLPDAFSLLYPTSNSRGTTVKEERERRNNMYVHAHIYVLLAHFYRQHKVARNVFLSVLGGKKFACTVTVPVS